MGLCPKPRDLLLHANLEEGGVLSERAANAARSSILAPESALGLRPRRALSSAQVEREPTHPEDRVLSTTAKYCVPRLPAAAPLR